MLGVPVIYWLVFGMLGYVLTTCVLSMLASRVEAEVQRHDLIVASKQKRLEYLARLEPAQDSETAEELIESAEVVAQ